MSKDSLFGSADNASVGVHFEVTMRKALLIYLIANAPQFALADGDPHYPDFVAASTSSQEQTTREQLRAELRSLQSVGYHVGDGDQTDYPTAIQAAQAQLSLRH